MKDLSSTTETEFLGQLPKKFETISKIQIATAVRISQSHTRNNVDPLEMIES